MAQFIANYANSEEASKGRRHGGVLGRGEAGEDSDRLQTMTDRDPPKTKLEQHPGESILSTWPATTATGVAVKKQEFEKSQTQKKAIQQQLQQALDQGQQRDGISSKLPSDWRCWPWWLVF